jgi:large subunit ribosomal protein L24
MTSRALRIAKQSGSFLRAGVYATLRRTVKESDRVKSWRILKGDQVEVIAGRDKGKQGRVARVMHSENRLVVAGLNLVKRHVKGHDAQPGSIQTIEAPIDVSNVALLDPADGQPTKIAMRYLVKDGRACKVRVSKRSGLVVDKPFSLLTYRERWNAPPGPKDAVGSWVHEATYHPSMIPLPEQRKAYLPSPHQIVPSD